MSTLKIQLLCRRSIDLPELAIFVSRPGAMINLHWLELPMARTDHEIFSTVILSLPLIQEGQLSVSGERMCTILVNRLED